MRGQTAPVESGPGRSSSIKKSVLAIVMLAIVLPALFWLSRLPSRQEFEERKSVSDRGAQACAALARDSAGLREVAAAVDAFEADMQLVLSIAARRAESRLEGGTAEPDTISQLSVDCAAVYDNRP